MINPLQGSALLPNPPVDDATASRLYDKWDTATPEEQDAMRPQLNAWADSKDAEAKAAADKKFEDIFSNFDTMGGHAAAIKNDPIFLQSTSPDETKAGAVNMAYLSHLTGKSMEEIGQNWPDVRAGYAQQFHGKSVQNDRQLYDLIAQEVSQKKVQREAFGNLASDAVVDAFHDIATGTPTDYLSKFAAWKESNQPAIQGIPEAEVQKKYQDLYESTADKIAGIAPQAKAIFDALAAETGRPDAPVGNPGDIQAIASSIQDLPPEQKAALYTVAQIYATRTGQSKGFWTQAAESIGRSITGSVGSIDLAVQQREAQAKLNMLKDGTAVLANAGTPNEVIIPKSGADVVRNDPTAGADSRNFTEITPEKNAELTAQLQEKIKHIVTVRELRSLASEGIDPIKPSSTWMWHSLEQGLYGAAGSLPLLATSLLQPEIGLPLVGTAIYGQEVDRMALAYPNVPIEHISTMATLSAAPQTLLMNLRAGAILGKLPVLGGYLKTLGNPQMNPIIRMGINMTGQMAEQGAAVMLQSAMPIMVDGIAKAVGEDMPEFDLKQSLQAYAQSTPEALFSVLPFVLIGASVATHSDFKRGAEMTASARGLREAGFTQAEADRISKIEDPRERTRAIQEGWDSRSQEDIKSGAEMITERIQGDAKMQADPTTPTMRVEDEVVNGQATGNKVFTVLDEQGNQKIQTTDPEAAVHYYEVAMQDAASAQRGHLNSLMEFFKGVDKEQGRERTYTIDTKFDNTKYGYSDDRVTAADEAAAGQSTERLAERMQQEGVPAGTPLDQVAIKGKTIPDLSRQIYSDTILVLDGRADTMVHERLDGEVMAALHEGRISQEQFLEWCKQTEKATGTPWLPEIPEGGQHSAQQIRETVTKIGEAYLAGRIRKIESIPQGMRGLFKKMLVYFQHVLAKAKVLRAALDAGKIDQNFHSFLAKSVGLPEEAMIDSHTARVTTEMVRGVEQAAPEISYAVRLKGDEFGDNLPFLELRKKAKKFIHSLIGSEVTNINNNQKIEFDKQSGKKPSSGPRKDEEIQGLAGIKEMLEKAKPIGAEPDSEGRADIKAWHKYEATAEIAGNPYTFILKVREMKNGHFFYDSYTKKEGLDATSSTASPREKLGDLKAPSPNGNVPQGAGDRNSSSSPLTETGGSTAYSLGQRDEGHGMPEFYSTMERLLESKIQGKAASADQVRGLISGNNGVKAEEIKWSGIHGIIDRLAEENGGKIPKDALMEALRNEGRVQFTEHVLSNNKIDDETLKIAEKYGYTAEFDPYEGYGFEDKDGEYVDASELPKAMREELKSIERKNQQPRYDREELKIPGGENYREVVLAMPSDKPKIQARINEIVKGADGREYTTEEKEELNTLHTERDGKQVYTSSHFPNHPNYVAHMRLNERTDSQGRPGLFIEELQSDRHQQGRERGYQGDKEYRAEEIPGGIWVVRDRTDRVIRSVKTEKEARDYIKTNDGNKTGVPDAPFRNDWHLQLFKRALRDAIASGKKWIGWTSGDTQAERYNQSRYVKHIAVRDNGDGTWKVTAEPRNGSRVETLAENAPKEKLEDIIGKDLAKKAIAGEGEPTGPNNEYRRFAGEDLKVGGDGMRGFYDKKVVNDIGKYVDRLGGGKVKKDTLLATAEGYKDPVFDIPMEIQQRIMDEVERRLRREGIDEEKDPDGYREKFIDKQTELSEKWAKENPVAGSESHSFWKVEITPKMEESVQSGQASYSLATKEQLDRLNAQVEKHLNRSPEARMQVYQNMRYNLDKVIRRNNASTLALREGREYQTSESEQAAEADRAARIADLHAEEQQEIRDALDANAAKFMGKIEGATPSEKRSINAQAKDRAAIIEKGIRQKYDEKIKGIENEAKIQPPKADGSEKYTQMIQSIGELEAVIKALPMEIRGKIGGYREILTKSTDAGRTTVLLKRIEMADKALEKLLKDGYGDQLKKILERSKPKKNEPGEKPKGIGADIQSIFSVLREAVHWTPELAQAHIEKLQGLIDKGEMTSEQEAHAQQEMGLIAHISDWQNADSVRRSQAIKALTNAWEKGYSEHMTRVLQRREAAEMRRLTLIKQTGKEGNKIERKERELDDLKLGSAWGKFIKSFYSFDQLVHSIWGHNSKEATRLSDEQRKAENLKEDRLQERWNGLTEIFKKMTGSIQKGEELRYAMSQPSLDFNGLHLSELEALSATMMWMQEDGRRHMEGKKDDSGKVVSSWGYTQADISRLEAKLSPEARILREYLLKKYEADWHTLNAVFREENGMDLPRNRNYSPLTVKPQRTQGNQMVDPVSGVAMTGMSTTPGSLLTRGSSIAEPEFRDVLQTYIGHNMQMEHYKAYAAFNRETAAVIRNRDLANAVEAGSGVDAREVLGKWLDLFAQGGSRDAASNLYVNKMLAKGTGRAAQMALVGKVGTLLVQSSQLGAAITEMPTGSYVKRLSMLLSGNLEWSAALNSPYIQRRIKELPPIARQAMDGLKSDKPSARKSAMQFMGTLIGGADGLFTAGTYAMVYDYHLTLAKEMGMTGAEAEAHARNTAERATDRLAQPTRMGAKSLFENTSMGNPLARLAFSFASESRKNLALLAYSMANRTPAEKARTFAFVGVMSGLVSNIIRSAWSDSKDDSDSETFDTKHWNWKRIAISTAIEPVQGIPVIGSTLQQGALGLAGIYSPNSDLLTQPAQEAFRAAKHVPNYIDGTADMQMLMKDVDGILHVMGLFSSEIAAYKSLESVAKDVWGVASNAKKAATEEK